MLFLLKGKCYDKIRQYNKAAKEYEKALKLAEECKLDDDVKGQIEFRLGWSIIRSKVNIK